jgi:hypothetical protein
MTIADAPGWRPDPEVAGQERYWNGTAWTDRVRLAGTGEAPRLPEHVPDLHRALAAATADIDAVEDRLSLLFERTDDAGGRGAADRGKSPGPTPAGGRDDGGGSGAAAADADFAELDAALAAEQADQPDDSGKGKSTGKRKMFRRRAKGSTPASG